MKNKLRWDVISKIIVVIGAIWMLIQICSFVYDKISKLNVTYYNEQYTIPIVINNEIENQQTLENYHNSISKGIDSIPIDNLLKYKVHYLINDSFAHYRKYFPQTYFYHHYKLFIENNSSTSLNRVVWNFGSSMYYQYKSGGVIHEGTNEGKLEIGTLMPDEKIELDAWSREWKSDLSIVCDNGTASIKEGKMLYGMAANTLWVLTFFFSGWSGLFLFICLALYLFVSIFQMYIHLKYKNIGSPTPVEEPTKDNPPTS